MSDESRQGRTPAALYRKPGAVAPHPAAPPPQAAVAAVLRDHGGGSGEVRAGEPAGSGSRRHRQERRDGGARGATGLPRRRGGEDRAAPRAARAGRPLHAGVHPDEASRRSSVEGAGAGRAQGLRHPWRPLAIAARPCAGRLSHGKLAGAGRNGHRRARHRRRGRLARHQLRAARGARELRPPHRPHRARGRVRRRAVVLRPRGTRRAARDRAPDAHASARRQRSPVFQATRPAGSWR